MHNLIYYLYKLCNTRAISVYYKSISSCADDGGACKLVLFHVHALDQKFKQVRVESRSFAENAARFTQFYIYWIHRFHIILGKNITGIEYNIAGFQCGTFWFLLGRILWVIQRMERRPSLSGMIIHVHVFVIINSTWNYKTKVHIYFILLSLAESDALFVPFGFCRW